ncbi:hypothetical protein AB0H28_16245 [Micromonospora sp. NPDC050980]|uniref:hypothetical protein n=1 Tax=Micromonospora sp. NPDC050980 TaxID=3155161 RepID=UPI0033C327D1
MVRIGDPVRRTPGADAVFAAALLRHLAATAPGVAPVCLGTDGQGWQVLSHVDGVVLWRDREDRAFFADAALTARPN